MTKSMQKLVFFIDSNDLSSKAYGSALTIGNLYMNRFTIDEDAGHEIVDIYGFEKCSICRSPFVKGGEQKGMGHIFSGIFLMFY